jgi:hypothetical protein
VDMLAPGGSNLISSESRRRVPEESLRVSNGIPYRNAKAGYNPAVSLLTVFSGSRLETLCAQMKG